jgi:hypothetical protein
MKMVAPVPAVLSMYLVVFVNVVLFRNLVPSVCIVLSLNWVLLTSYFVALAEEDTSILGIFALSEREMAEIIQNKNQNKKKYSKI